MIKLIIADDDAEDIELFEKGVVASSHIICTITVNCGNDLIKKLQTEDADAIVLDVNMPIKDGEACINEIRCNDHFSNIPIFVFSTADHKLKIEACLNAGADYYLIKPSTFEGLIKVIDFIYETSLIYNIKKLKNRA